MQVKCEIIECGWHMIIRQEIEVLECPLERTTVDGNYKSKVATGKLRAMTEVVKPKMQTGAWKSRANVDMV